MLRHCAHQAAGLLALGDSHPLSVVVVVQHGDEQAELPFLWRLCQTLTAAGQCVTVLDGSSSESGETPGLQQRLQAGRSQNTPQVTWSVLPASKGLMELSLSNPTSYPSWRALAQCFDGAGMLILYCTAQCASKILGGVGVTTLLPVSPQRSSLLASYLALKQLLVVGGQRPTIINVLPPETDVEDRAARSVCTSLVECAKSFLNFEAPVIPFVDPVEDFSTAAGLSRLVSTLIGSVAVKDLPEMADLQLQRRTTGGEGYPPLHWGAVDVYG